MIHDVQFDDFGFQQASVHFAQPSGGCEQAKAISLASFSPSKMRGTGGVARCLRFNTASMPPCANCCRTRDAHDRTTPRSRRRTAKNRRLMLVNVGGRRPIPHTASSSLSTAGRSLRLCTGFLRLVRGRLKRCHDRRNPNFAIELGEEIARSTRSGCGLRNVLFGYHFFCPFLNA